MAPSPENRPGRTERRAGTAPTTDRRRHDAGAPAGTPERRTARELFRKFRQPIIGLGMAGAALPMVQAQSQHDAAPEPVDTAPANDVAAARATADTEDALVEQIAESREDQERSTHVEEAVSRYNIGRDLAEDIYDIARENKIEPKLAFGLVRTESTFDERAKSGVGARGLTQVMPRTAAWLVPGTKTEDLYDRKTNLRLGFKYLNNLIDKYRGDVRLALLAYNRGPGTVDKVLKRGGDPNNGYADKVLRT
jgi:soluble lytic murein transglycosylase-like protein